MRIVDLRIQTIDIPKQEVLSKDNVSAFINAVVYFKIAKPEAAIFNVQDYGAAVYQHSQTAIRDVVGSRTLDQLLTDRKSIAESISQTVEKDANEWGLIITGIKIQDIVLPDTMKKAMARQAQAEREKRASIIISQGESMAADKLAQAAKILSESPGALHLRTLQMISSVSADKTNIMNFLLPIEGVQLPGKGSNRYQAEETGHKRMITMVFTIINQYEKGVRFVWGRYRHCRWAGLRLEHTVLP